MENINRIPDTIPDDMISRLVPVFESFGIMVIQMEMALITPPVGMNLFIMGSMVKKRGISMGTIYRGVLPFSATIMAFNILILFFPAIATWLPSLMK